MEDRQKWVNLSLIAFSGLVAYILFELFYIVSSTYDLETRIRNIDLILRAGSVGIGAVIFFVLYRHDKANQFMNEAVVELTRVTWPTQKDTSRATIVVIIMVVISGLVLGGLDSLWTWIMKQVL